MVITPQQVRETLNRRDQAQLKKLEAQIDQNLMIGTNAINLVGNLTPRIRNSLVHRYDEAGWEVQCVQDPAKGNYLYFKERKEVIGFRPYGKL